MCGIAIATAPLSTTIATSAGSRGRNQAISATRMPANHHTEPVNTKNATFSAGDSPSMSCGTGIPAQKYIAIRMIGNASEVPRSGSLATSSSGTSVNSIGGSQ